MKKIIISSLLAAVLIISGAAAFLILSDTMLIQMPVLVKQKPILTYAIGTVQYRENGQEKWTDAVVGMKFTAGTEIKTGEKSFADIRFHKGTAVRLTENSSFRIKDLSIREMKVQINEGALFGKFERIHKNHTIELQTSTTVAAIRGTELGIEIGKADIEPDMTAKNNEQEPENQQEATTVYSLSGIIGVYNSNYYEDTVLLSNQKKLVVLENSPPSNPEKMNDEEIEKLQSILNAIHEDEVLFISDKIHFKTGSSSILHESYPELDKISTILAQRDEKIRIEGHTDTDGKAHTNQILSLERAKSIKEYLVTKGIKAERLSIIGYGESKPIAGNSSEEGKAQNRRVEFIIVE
ncbi:MAG TPA: OmpA family protein [Spirochaetota bacterium]|nr:OmpA family protein [Spirochaetota bacterium]HPI89515.1 OmpA family protein [Spirochaetota bacterium]HPR47103.1 OmpA family protein [Spirochaetota bacterium]